MKGSRIADEIIADMKREEFFKQRAIRNKLNRQNQCKERKHQDICEEGGKVGK